MPPFSFCPPLFTQMKALRSTFCRAFLLSRYAIVARMSEDPDSRRVEADKEVERELRQSRKFSPQEAMARMAGPGAMKGASPISPVVQAETAIATWLDSNVADETGVLQALLCRNLKGSEALLNKLDEPLKALAGHCDAILASDYLLKELVREADVEWGRRMDERPIFEREGSPPQPGDPYTAESVRRVLEDVRARLAGE